MGFELNLRVRLESEALHTEWGARMEDLEIKKLIKKAIISVVLYQIFSAMFTIGGAILVVVLG